MRRLGIILLHLLAVAFIFSCGVAIGAFETYEAAVPFIEERTIQKANAALSEKRGNKYLLYTENYGVVRVTKILTRR